MGTCGARRLRVQSMSKLLRVRLVPLSTERGPEGAVGGGWTGRRVRPRSPSAVVQRRQLLRHAPRDV
eukprot:291693-Pleurochrysis_carterae.AAC.3